MLQRTPAEDPTQAFDRTLDAVAASDPAIWIGTVPRARAVAMLTEARKSGDAGALRGVPFAVKDNIDLAGLPTTAGCPDFAYVPARSAEPVERLVAAGAVPVGKTNLDQFATGLNGTRSPYGTPPNAFDTAFVPGGSSSGSAVAVALGLVPFALGTDTAGSGRVPAAFNNVVGLKPTRGLVSTRGVVPACRSLDCVSVFAQTVAEALDVLRAMAGFDAADPFSRRAPADAVRAIPMPAPRFGVPDHAALSACSPEALALFDAAVARMEACGGTAVPIDFAPFREAGTLVYAGPWVVERLAALRAFVDASPDSIDPAVRAVLLSGTRFSAADVWDGQYRLAGLVRQAEAEWARMDVMLVPTAPFVPTVAAMRADPVGLNAALGAYTNFVNPMDLAAVAVPAGFTADGMPFGVTLVGRAFSDGALALLGDRLHRAWAGATLGASGRPLAGTRAVMPDLPIVEDGTVRVAVVGAHLSGQPLNGQLTGRGGHLVATVRTAPGYSLYALPGTVPPKPGLVRDGGAGGIEAEVWRLPLAGYGALVAGIPAPLAIGTVTLADGDAVQGFVCEAHAVAGALDITHLGGWRAYVGRDSHSQEQRP